MHISNNIFIIGFMGCGKTTVGKKLAKSLGWKFIDLDKKIEEFTGMTIPEIFSMHGEAYFRQVESETLKSVRYHTNTVISTGGGCPCFADNMDYMLENGLTIYLKLTPGMLKTRLTGAKVERPLIKGLSDDELLSFIKEKLSYREEWYNRADIILEGDDLNISSIISIVKSRLKI